jgi:glycosyltransferase involved in cell wall biosynthesis
MIENKRICFIITRLVAGGAQKVVLDLINALHKENPNIYLIAGPETGREGSFWPIAQKILPAENLLKCPHMVRSVNPIKDLLAYFWLKKKLAQLKVDIVHTHTSKSGVLGRLAAKKINVPVIIHSTHGLIYSVDANIPGVKGRLAISIFKKLEIMVGKFTDHLITLSENETGDAIRLNLINSSSVTAVSNGILLDGFAAIERDLHSWEGQYVRLGIAGRLNAEKGHDILIRAVRNLAQKFPHVTLKIAGDGPLLDSLQNLTKECGIEENVTFCGFLEDMESFLKEIDIFILSSHYEGFGIVLVEAMAAGIPIVATDVGGVREVVDDGRCGIVVPPGSEGELTLGIEYFLQNPRIAYEYGQYGRKAALEKFSLNKMVESHKEIYTSFFVEKRNENIPNNYVKVDFHMHSLKSFDSELPIETIIEHAKKNNLRAIAITDHDIMEAQRKARLLAEDNLMVVSGMEITTNVGDVIALFVEKPIKSKDFFAAIKEIREQNGIVYLPHPFRGRRSISLDLIKEIDVFEVYNGRSQGINIENDQFGNHEIVNFAMGNTLTGLGGSDAHHEHDLFKVISYIPSFNSEEELKTILLSNRIFPVYENGEPVEATMDLY